jgi:dTDP-4-dehydrorhamnose reductase
MDKDKILILGDGFLGQAFKRHGYEVWGRDKFEWGIDERRHSIMPGAVVSRKFEAVVNTIGISDTRFCEDDDNWNIIYSVNGKLPTWLSEEFAIRGIKFVHISTGCLYDKNNGVAQKEDDFKAAHCNYVVSKWIGEIGCDPERDIILRPRLLFDSHPPAAGKRNNLLCKMKEFTTFVDEYNTITSLDTIVEATQALLDEERVGVFNVGQTGAYTNAYMARHLGLDVKSIMKQEDLHKSQGLYLVNNLMDLAKLSEVYEPRDTLVELDRCWKLLNEGTE